MTRKRAGRKRKLARREPSGRVARVTGAGQGAAAKADPGTPELQAKRQALAAGGDPAATTRWLDLLTAWGLLSPRQQQAGADYARLRAWLFGAPGGRLKAGNLDPEQAHRKGTRRPEPLGPSERLSDAALLTAKRRYERATRRLRSVSRQMEAEVRALVLDNRPPLIAVGHAVGRPSAQAVIPAAPHPQLSPLGGAGGPQAGGAVPRVHGGVPRGPRGGSSELASAEARPRMTAGGASGPQGLPSAAALKQWAWLSVGLEVLDAALAEDNSTRRGA